MKKTFINPHSHPRGPHGLTNTHGPPINRRCPLVSFSLDPKFHWLRQIATTLRQFHWHLFSIGHCSWFYKRGKRGSYLVLAIAPFWSWFNSQPKIASWRSQWNLGYTSFSTIKEIGATVCHRQMCQMHVVPWNETLPSTITWHWLWLSWQSGRLWYQRYAIWF